MSRRAGWQFHARLSCPRGHTIPEHAIILEHGGIRCPHRPAGAPECGALMWVYLAGRRPLPGHVQPRWVAEVTIGELREMQRADMYPEQVIEFLGGTFPTERSA